jgi:hypothetical protein
MLLNYRAYQGIMPGGGPLHLLGKFLPERGAIFEICEKEGERSCVEVHWT